MDDKYSDAFYVLVRKVSQDGSYVVTLPKKNVEFEGWNEGDNLKIIAKKVVKKENDE